MSKSLGNSLRVEEILRTVRPVELRYYLGQAHYRSVLEFSPDSLAEAAAAYKRIEGFTERAAEALADDADARGAPPDGSLPLSFTSALDDDLGVPAALAAVHAAVRDGNTALQQGRIADVRESLAQVRAMLGVLGLNPLAPPWANADAQGERMREIVQSLVQVALDQRESRGPGRILRPLTRCGKAWRRPGSSSRTPPAGPAGRSGDEWPRFRRRPPGQGNTRQIGQAASRHGRLRAAPPGGQGPHAARSSAARSSRPAQDGGRPRAAGARRGDDDDTGRGTRAPAGRPAGARARVGARGSGDAPEMVAGRNSVVEALRAAIPAVALYVEHRAPPMRRSVRPCNWPRKPACRCGRLATRSSAG